MERTLKIKIDSGDKTCWNGKRLCPYVMTSHFGTRWHCKLFGSIVAELADENGVRSGSGMLQRMRECLELECKS